MNNFIIIIFFIIFLGNFGQKGYRYKTALKSLYLVYYNQCLFLYRRVVRREANLEVTGEEKPKTRLRRRKANKRLCREKKPVWALPDEEKTVSLVSDEKSQFAPSSGEKLQQATFHTRKKSKSLTRRWSGVRVLGLAKTAGGTSLWQIMRHVSWGFCEWAFFQRFKLFYVSNEQFSIKMRFLSLVIAFSIFQSYKWAREFIKKGKRSVNLSCVSLKNVDFKKIYRLLKIE